MIRAYRDSDLSALLGLITGVLSEYGFAANVGGVERDLADIANVYGKERAGFWVAELEGEVMGSIAIRPRVDRTCELKRLYVRKEARGHGIGRALYAHAEAFARSANYDRIWLDSSRRFASARRLCDLREHVPCDSQGLYEHNGFVLLEELDNDWEDNVYEKLL